MAGLSWFKVYAAETLSDENFQGWDVAERGAWFTLLCVAWREGSIPGDQQTLAKLLHLDGGAMRSVWSAIGSRFVEHPDHPGRLSSPRLETEREAAQLLHAKKVGAGKNGARSRWDKRKRTHSRAIAAPKQDDSKPLANDSDQVRKDQGRAAQEDLAASPAGSPPPFASMPVVGSEDFAITEAMVAEWVSTFPALDVKAEVLRAIQWCRDNPAKRKTARGARAFLGRWLGRAQDSGGGRNGAPAKPRVIAPAAPHAAFREGDKPW